MRARGKVGWPVVLASFVAACATLRLDRPDVPFRATPEGVVTGMLALAEVSADDVVYDLGSGDGRLVIEAARRFGARAVGVELEPRLVHESRERAFMAGVADRVRFLWQDLFQTDLAEATVVTLYLLPEVNRRLRPKLLRELRPGARVVSHDYDMGDWRPDRVLRIAGPERRHALYAWVVPAHVEGTWRWQRGESRYALRLRQRFQDLTGTIDADGAEAPVHELTLAGDRLRVRVGGAPSGGPGAIDLDGRVLGHTIVGRARAANGSPVDEPWRATREPR